MPLVPKLPNGTSGTNVPDAAPPVGLNSGSVGQAALSGLESGAIGGVASAGLGIVGQGVYELGGVHAAAAFIAAVGAASAYQSVESGHYEMAGFAVLNTALGVMAIEGLGPFGAQPAQAETSVSSARGQTSKPSDPDFTCSDGRQQTEVRHLARRKSTGRQRR